MVAEVPVVTGRLLTFRVGPGRFAVPLDAVIGVQNPGGSGAGTGGEVVFQGQTMAAVDARAVWWRDSGPAAVAPAVIVVESGGGALALLVDRIEGIVEGVEMRPLPALVEPFVKNLFRGVTQHADGDRLVVAPAALPGAARADQQGGPGEA